MQPIELEGAEEIFFWTSSSSFLSSFNGDEESYLQLSGNLEAMMKKRNRSSRIRG